MLKFKLVDLSDQIAAEVAELQKQAPLSGVHGGMHLGVTTEDGQIKVTVVPPQMGPSTPSGYGDELWGPCPTAFRSAEYHDPVQPGSIVAGDDGKGTYVWVAEQGWTPIESASAETVGGLKALTDAALAYAKTASGKK